MSDEINRIRLKGRVREVAEKRSGEGPNGPWKLYSVTLEGVEGAGKKKDDRGIAVYSAFNKAPTKGSVIGQVCRVQGYEFNKDGKVGYGAGLQAIGKPKVFEEAPSESVESKPKAGDDYADW